MSIWTRIAAALSALASGESLSAVFASRRKPPEKTVAFAIAVIALGAKMAKADGRVTRDEVAAFREVFQIPARDEAKAARVFNLARQDVAGFEEYARKIARLFGDDRAALADILEGLFYIAMADGTYHPNENAFLIKVAQIFDVDAVTFRSLRARVVPEAEQDPYAVLGVSHELSSEKVRAVWRRLVRENHPDRMRARGVPVEAVRLAEKRLMAINGAWEKIRRDKAA